MMALITSYCYIECKKLLRSQYTLVLALIALLLAVFVLSNFKNSIDESFQIHKLLNPETDFVDFFMQKLSGRLHLLSYLLAVSICLLSIELDLQSKFLSKSIYTLPVNLITYLIAKILICSAFVIVTTGVLHVVIPSLVISGFENRIINLDEPIENIVALHWLIQSLFLVPIVSFIIAYSVILRQGILISFVLLFLFYFLASGLPYFYPLSLLPKFGLLTTHHADWKYYLIGLLSLTICVVSGLYALTKRKYA
ncbi:hypothetical protein BH09BAC3_BH09BAC3_38110 [soil metagenome]